MTPEDFVNEITKLVINVYKWEAAPEAKHKANGDGGTTWERTDIEELTRRILSGESLHDSALKIAGSYAGRAAPKQDCIDYIGLAFTAAHQARYGGRWDECMAAINYCYAKQAEKQTPPPPPPLAWISPQAWATNPPDPPSWTVRDLIPRHRVTLFTGHGAAGKSTVALHLCAAHVLGKPWLNFFPEMGPAFFIDAEDEPGVICQRLQSIAEFYGANFFELADLRILSLADKDALLATADRGVIKPTPLFLALEASAKAVKPQQIVIASAANVYAGNEIDRSQVTQFIQLLNRLAVACDGSVILISHPSVLGMASDSGISGSTGWHNAVRSQMYLKGVKDDGNGDDSSDLRLLEFKKNQYGKPAATLTLEYSRGMFLPIGGATDFERAAHEAKADHVFHTLLARFSGSGRSVSHQPQSREKYAPKAFANEPEAKLAGLRVKDLADAMQRAFQRQQIRVAEYGAPSRGLTRIEFVP